MIGSYDFGKIKIDGREYNHDVIIYPALFDKKGGGVYPDKVDSWWREESHLVGIEDIKEIITKKPKTVIFGTGDSGIMKVSEETKKYLEKSGIKVIIEPTKKACDIYNKLSEKENIIVALHLTC
jgi:hypothetical protein